MLLHLLLPLVGVFSLSRLDSFWCFCVVPIMLYMYAVVFFRWLAFLSRRIKDTLDSAASVVSPVVEVEAHYCLWPQGLINRYNFSTRALVALPFVLGPCRQLPSCSTCQERNGPGGTTLS